MYSTHDKEQMAHAVGMIAANKVQAHEWTGGVSVGEEVAAAYNVARKSAMVEFDKPTVPTE